MIHFLSNFAYIDKQKFRTLLAGISLPFYFLALYVLFTSSYDNISDDTLRYFFHHPFVSFCVYLIHLISPANDALVAQSSIVSGNINLEFVRTCDCSNPFFLLTAAILVFRSTLKLTVIGILGGFILLMTLNIFRIVSLYFLISDNPVWFSYLHSSIAPFLLLSISCAYFSFWAYYANEVKHARC